MGWCEGGFSRGGMMGGGRFMSPFLGFFVFAVVAVAVVLFVLWLVRRSRHATGGSFHTAAMTTPLQVAQRRLAAGEITVEEFERIRERLRDSDRD